MNKLEIAKFLFSLMLERGNKFFSEIEVEYKELFDLRSQAIVLAIDPNILKQNFDKVLAFMSENMPITEYIEYENKAKLCVSKFQSIWIRANKPISTNPESYAILRRLFCNIGWFEEFEYGMNQECRTACLHGLIDSAFDDYEGEVYRGKLFSLIDYCEAKEALADLGKDKFELQAEANSSSPLPINYHLFEE